MTIAAEHGADPSVRRLVRLLAPLAAILGIVGTTAALSSPFMALFLSKELHASPVRTAAFLFLTPMASVLVTSGVGWLSDRGVERRTLLLCAAVAGAVGYLGYAVLQQYWIMLGIAMTMVASAGALFPQSFAMGKQILDEEGSTRGPMAMTWLRMMISISWVIGPPLAGLLLTPIGYQGLFLATAVGFVGAAVVTMVWVPRAGGAARRRDERAVAAGGSAPAAVLWITTVAFTLIQTAAMIGVIAMPLFVSDVLHAPVGRSGFVLGLCAAIEIPFMLGSGALATRLPLRRLVLAGTVIGVGYYAAVSVTTATWQLALAQLANACFISAVLGLGISYFQDLLPERPGHASTMFSNTNRVASMLAGPIFGMAQHFGYRLAYLTGAVLCAVGLIMLVLPVRASARPS